MNDDKKEGTITLEGVQVASSTLIWCPLGIILLGGGSSRTLMEHRGCFVGNIGSHVIICLLSFW